MGECGKCLWHNAPWYLVFQVHGRVRLKGSRSHLGLVSDCSVHGSLPCEVALAADKGNSLHLPLWVPLKSHTVPVFFRQETNVCRVILHMTTLAALSGLTRDTSQCG